MAKQKPYFAQLPEGQVALVVGPDDALRKAVGLDFIHRIRETPDKAPLRIGTTIYTTEQLATKLGIVHKAAAKKLSDAADAIGATSARDFYQKSTPYSFATLPGFGVTTLYVAWKLFEAEGLDPEQWFARGQEEAVVTFNSLKLRAQKKGDLMSDAQYARKRKMGGR